MDPLTQIIGVLRPRALLWKQSDADGDWTASFPANDGTVFCLMAGGSGVLNITGREPTVLEEGGFLLLHRPPVWTLERNPNAEARARIVGGHFSFDGDSAGLLEGLLAPVVEIGAGDGGAGRLRGVLDLIGDEASVERPGQALVVERLLEVMLVEVIRHGAAGVMDGRAGLVAGLADARIAAALRALHGDVAHGWTVASLAAVAGMSRSVFAERFGRLVGMAPIDYLLQWRMALAKDALRRGRQRLAQIAAGCGYGSASAFSAAFSRTVGCSPSRYAAGPGLEALRAQ